MFLLLVACFPPEDCTAFNPSGAIDDDVLGCEDVEICCRQYPGEDTECAYVTGYGARYNCLSEADCTSAFEDLVDDVCTFHE